MQNFATVHLRASGNILLTNLPSTLPEATPERIAENKKFVEECARARDSWGTFKAA